MAWANRHSHSYSGETKGLMFIDDKTWEMRESIDDKNIEFFKPLYEQTIM